MKKILNEPILVGRQRELGELQHCLQSVIEGKGTTLFISGEAGVGKTRLIQEFLRGAKQEKDITSISGWCLPNFEVPYFPFIEAFNGFYSTLRKDGKKEIEPNPLMQGLESTWQLQHLTPQAIKDQAFLTVAKLMRQIVAQKPIILLLEDIQWADSASLALIHYIARAFNGSEKVLFIATFRSENLTSDAKGYPNPLVETLSMLKREDLLNVIKLPGLDKACILRMIESMLGGTVQKSLAEKLAVRSAGIPLFVVESIRMLLEQGKIVQENNEWSLKVEKIDVPVKIRDIIIQRLACLNKGQRRILDAASVIGDEFNAGLLSAIVDQDSLEVLETLNAIVKSTSIILIDEDCFKFDHAISREIVYRSIAKPLREAYHNRLAEKIEAAKSTLMLSDLAYHYAQAKNKEKAIKYSLAAGKDELKKCSNIEAIKHFTFVLQTEEQDTKRTNIKEKALEGLGDACYASGLFQKATRSFEELSNTAKTSIVKLRALRKAAESAFQQGNPLLVLELVKKTKPYISADRLEKARVLVCRSRAFMLQSKSGYQKDLEDALQVFEEEYSLGDTAWTLMDVAGCHAGRGKGKDHQGLAEALRSISLFGELGDFHSQMEVCYTAGYAFINCLLYKEALDVYAKIKAINENMKMNDYLHTCYAYAWSGILLWLYEEDTEKSLEYNLKALELSKKTDSLVAQGIVYANLVRLYVLLGDMKRAEEYFLKLAKFPPEIFNFNPVYGEFARAVFLAGNGQLKALEKLLESMEAAPYPYWSGWLPSAKWIYALMLEKQGSIEEARIHFEKVKRIRRDTEEKFEHVNMQASIMVHRQVIVGEEFEMRFDLVNVGRRLCKVIKIKNAIPSEFDVVSLPSFCSQQNGFLQLSNRAIEEFKVETIKLKLKANKANDFNIQAEVIFTDDLGETKISKLNPILITAKQISTPKKIASIYSPETSKVEFDSLAAKKAFNYLLIAFKKDSMKQILPEERGWRTLMEISRNAHIPKYSLYGRYRRGGEATRELKQSALVESRFFLGERSRGGRVLKIRIRYEKRTTQQ